MFHSSICSICHHLGFLLWVKLQNWGCFQDTGIKSLSPFYESLKVSCLSLFTLTWALEIKCNVSETTIAHLTWCFIVSQTYCSRCCDLASKDKKFMINQIHFGLFTNLSIFIHAFLGEIQTELHTKWFESSSDKLL